MGALRRPALPLLLAPLALAAGSCVFLAGAAIGAGAIYVLGEDAVETHFDAPFEEVFAACRAEVEAGGEVEEEHRGAKEGSLTGNADDIRYDLRLTAVTAQATRVVVQARKWRTLAPDLDGAKSFVDRLALRLQ